MAVGDRSVAGGSCALALGTAELQPCQLPVPWERGQHTHREDLLEQVPLSSCSGGLGMGWGRGRGRKPRHLSRKVKTEPKAPGCCAGPSLLQGCLRARNCLVLLCSLRAPS